jgi:hypothetical protein
MRLRPDMTLSIPVAGLKGNDVLNTSKDLLKILSAEHHG